MFKVFSKKLVLTVVACLLLVSGLLIGFSGTHVVARMPNETRFADCPPDQPIALFLLNLTLSQVDDGSVGLAISSKEAGSLFVLGVHETVPIPAGLAPLGISVQCIVPPSFAQIQEPTSTISESAVFDGVMRYFELTRGTTVHAYPPMFRYRRGLFEEHDLDYLACAAWAMDALRPELIERHLAKAAALRSERTGRALTMRVARLEAMKIAHRLRSGQSTELERASRNLGDACYGI